VIVRTEPDTNAVRVQTDRVILEFSEQVDRRSVEQAVFISPWPGQVEYDWSGTEVAILFPAALRNNRTYVVSVGTDVIDRRERNRLAAGFSLAFSTGDSLDRGGITGRVYDEKPEGVMVFAYLLDGIDRDTLNPGTLRPDYVTQTGSHGVFSLSNLMFGAYRVVAVRDEFHDMLYGRQIDQYGVPTGDIVLDADHPRVEGLSMRLAAEDTSHPFLTNVHAIDRSMLQIRFSEPIDSMSLTGMAMTLVDTLTGAQVTTPEPYLTSEAPSIMMLPLVQDLDSGAAYRLQVRELTDLAGNLLDSTNASAVFVVGGGRDTIPPRWTIAGVKDSLRGYSVDQPLIFAFSEPVDREAAERGITMMDSARVPTEFEAHWSGPTELALVFRHPLKSRTWYETRVILDSLRDLRGNVRRDSTRRIRFETFDLKMTGSIEGWVKDSSRGGGTYEVVARSTGTPDPVDRTVRLPHPGSFQIAGLPEGLYSVWAYKDADSSGGYSFGLPFTFVPSETFTVLADTLKVRARWGVEGVGLILR
jgi:hypothetical protein